MKRFHVHLSVKDLDESIRFYSRLFASAPTVTKPDYAKWMLDDPRINFAISSREGQPGVNHLGIQVDEASELQALRAQAAQAGLAARDEPGAACCYAQSDKHWLRDPQGIPWEAFHTLGTIPVFGRDADAVPASASACCPAPANPQAVSTSAPAACCG
ncbi:MAG TPA: ArsI/CadI family heavy metal resistance metalloenzyme [Solimonas sp.]|nr:ArsI/CadI family heavy metal resistance metalloenzyme [Solimonas sp.]